MLHPNMITTATLSYSKATNCLTGEMSLVSYPRRAVDFYDNRLKVMSHVTGRVVDFELVHISRDEELDVLRWELLPVEGQQLDAVVEKARLIIFND